MSSIKLKFEDLNKLPIDDFVNETFLEKFEEDDKLLNSQESNDRIPKSSISINSILHIIYSTILKFLNDYYILTGFSILSICIISFGMILITNLIILSSVLRMVIFQKLIFAFLVITDVLFTVILKDIILIISPKFFDEWDDKLKLKVIKLIQHLQLTKQIKNYTINTTNVEFYNQCYSILLNYFYERIVLFKEFVILFWVIFAAQLIVQYYLIEETKNKISIFVTNYRQNIRANARLLWFILLFTFGFGVWYHDPQDLSNIFEKLKNK
ncbi:hypothetical protein WICMUC_000270 [Wickerhamomyces mucosus]|uniref:Uncharacterized protein n=1 Tax=Wickerhamomyces mucosus TaxID=1378264 RepID=A0A9P8PY59_9ASCO|nr:hypothetical protein WICMUC_000270 [Wickerhamomyces mucosus]